MLICIILQIIQTDLIKHMSTIVEAITRQVMASILDLQCIAENDRFRVSYIVY